MTERIFLSRAGTGREEYLARIGNDTQQFLDTSAPDRRGNAKFGKVSANSALPQRDGLPAPVESRIALPSDLPQQEEEGPGRKGSIWVRMATGS